MEIVQQNLLSLSRATTTLGHEAIADLYDLAFRVKGLVRASLAAGSLGRSLAMVLDLTLGAVALGLVTHGALAPAVRAASLAAVADRPLGALLASSVNLSSLNIRDVHLFIESQSPEYHMAARAPTRSVSSNSTIEYVLDMDKG